MKGKLSDNRIFSAAIMVVLTIVILFGYHMTRGTVVTARQLTTPVHIEPIDSSSCIACHTSESVIGSVVMETDEGHGSEGA
ncbi:MAG: hypothetical protein GX300_08765 [Tissierellia bacterium]|nr:hypothetical protein [Tissierellia bacterium]